jgi:tetratricopeptide (TPR) repeat protein
LPTVGTPGLAETSRMINTGIDNLTELAERAVAMGDVQSAQLVSDAVLRREPGNVKAQTVQRVIDKSAAGGVAAAGVAATSGEDLNLVRTAQADAPADAAPQPDTGFPAEGSLTDRFAPEGVLLDETEQEKRVFSQMLRREVENTAIDARRQMRDSPELAAQQLKLTLQNVERATELDAATRAQLMDKLQTALREVQRASAIKDELDAEREEALAASRERQMLNARLARQQEKEKQLTERFMALIDEKQYDEAGQLAAILEEVDPEGVVPRVADVWGRLQREQYLQQVARLARWKGFSDTLYQVDLSAIPFPDDPPVVYPEASVWEALTERRKKSSSVDLKKKGSADEKIDEVLDSPLLSTGLQFTDVPLEQVVANLRDQYDIEVQIDGPALDDVGLGPDELVTVDLRNITLRSALRLMLGNLQLTYVIRDEVLMITTKEEAETELVVKVYPVADLVLPIELPSLGGGGGLGGGIGGGGGGGLGGGGGGGLGGGGGGGFGGGGGGFGGGGQGGGGGGFFSVPDDAQNAAPSATAAPAAEKASHPSDAAKAQKADQRNAAIEVDPSVKPEVFWDRYFQDPKCDPAAVRQTVRELMGKHQLDQVVVLIEAALRNGQPQSWMYESLGIALELSGKSKQQIERAVMSAADFSTSPDELMYIARYLSRLGLDQRALQLYQQVVKVEPLRSEAYLLGLQAAQRCDDLAGIQWAIVAIVGQAWPKGQESIQDTANDLAKAILERLAKEGRQAERDVFLAKLQEASIRDCVVRVSWTGEADVDVSVEEPTGSICSFSEPRTTGGGAWLGDAYSSEGRSLSGGMSEVYVCPRGFAGTYRVRIHRVWGDVTAGKVTVDVYTHLHGDEVQHERHQLDLGDKDALAIFDLNAGRRTEPLEAGQLAAAFDRQRAVSRAVLAQQLDSLSDESVIPSRADAIRFRRGFLAGGGAVGYQPIITTLSSGTQFVVTGVVSADRRYVRISPVPSFMTIGNVQTFTFAGVAAQTNNGTGTGTGTGGATLTP